jgi:hypothetical protein
MLDTGTYPGHPYKPGTALVLTGRATAGHGMSTVPCALPGVVPGYMSPRYPGPMVALAGKVPVDEITARGRQVRPRPGRMLLTAVLGVFFALGWLAGRAWMLAADCWVAVRLGYLHGRGLPDEEIARRMTPPEPAPVPA